MTNIEFLEQCKKEELEFKNRLEQVTRILKDSNVTIKGKEEVYHNFLEEYPFFDSSRLDYINW